MISNEKITNYELKRNNVTSKTISYKKKFILMSDSSGANNVDSNQNQNLLSEKKFKKSLAKDPLKRDAKQMLASDRKLNADISEDYQRNRNNNHMAPQKSSHKKFPSAIQFNYKHTNSFRIKMKRWLFKHKKLVPTLFLIYSFIILLITGFDLMNYINKKKLILEISFCFIIESIFSLLIIIFYIVNYSIRLSNSPILIIVLTLIIFLLKTSNILIYLMYKNKFMIFLLNIISNLLMFIVNCFNLVISFYYIKKNKNALKNIEDIINLSKKNNDILQGKKNIMKGEQKPIALVEENIKS